MSTSTDEMCDKAQSRGEKRSNDSSDAQRRSDKSQLAPQQRQSSSVPLWVFKEMGPLARLFEVHSSSSDGNCFFESIRMILETTGIHRTIEQLRQVVAKPVLDPRNEIVNKTIQNWLELYQGAKKENDRMLMEEYKHMSPLADDVTLPLKESNRQLLYQSMLTRYYWGEQHACRIIEEQTQMRFLVFSGDTQRPSLTWYHSTAFKPTHYCFLFNAQQHYMPVSFQGQFIFKWEEIPYEVQLFFSKAYVTPKKE
jgi:hypothetical protein